MSSLRDLLRRLVHAPDNHAGDPEGWIGNQARLLEIDGNLAGSKMTVLDTSVFLAARKAAYERQHPGTRVKTGAALAARRWDATEKMSVVSFVTATAEVSGRHERKIYRLVAAGSGRC